MAHDYQMLTKTVKVSDPWCWKNEETVEVMLWVTPPVLNNKATVEVIVNPTSSRSVSRGIKVESNYDIAIQSYYEHFKKYLFDKIPEIISLDWLYEHGYLPK